jgi:hypothetical protein
VPLDIVPGGGHQATVWRAALTPMLDWMTPQLSAEVVKAEWYAKHGRASTDHKPVKHPVVAKKPSPLT